MTSRRGFLATLFVGAAAATVDPEKLLWVPGRKLISIPKPTPARLGRLTAGDIVQEAFRVSGLFFPGEQLSRNDLDFGLQALNRMLDGWSTQPFATLECARYPDALAYHLAAEICPAYGHVPSEGALSLLRDALPATPCRQRLPGLPAFKDLSANLRKAWEVAAQAVRKQ